jgi:hypothetical protein
MNTCPTCGESVIGQKFCPQCGMRLVETDVVITAEADSIRESPALGASPAAVSAVAPPSAAPAPAAVIAAVSARLAVVPIERYVASVLRALAVYGATWVLGVVATLLVLIESTGSNSPGVSWGWLFFAPGQLVGLALGGVLTVSASAFGVSGSVNVLALPLLLTAAVIVGTLVVSRRDERAHPTPSRGARWLLSAAAGLALALVSTLVAAIFPLSMSTGGGSGIAALTSVSVSASAASVTLFFGAFILGTIASYVGRSRVVVGRAPSGRDEVGLLRGTIRSTVPLVGIYLGVAGVILAVTVLILLVVGGAGSAIWSALLWLPTIVADGLAFMNFAAITIGGSAATLPTMVGVPPTVWMPSVVPAWVTILMLVVDLVLIAFIGTALRLRRGDAKSSPAMRWGTTVISFAATGAVLSVIGSTALWSHLDTSALSSVFGDALAAIPSTSGAPGLAAAGSSALDASASLTLTAGPAAWTFLIFAIIGALVEASSLYIAPFVLAAVPANVLAGASRLFARVGVAVAVDGSFVSGGAVPAAVQSPPPARMTPARKRLLKVIAASIGGVVLIVVLASIAISILSTTVFGPQQKVTAYLHSIVAKDASAAVADGNVTPSGGSRVLLTNSVMRATKDGISGFSITSVHTSGDVASVDVQIDQGGTKSTKVYTVHRTGSSWLFFPTWALNAVSLPSLSVDLTPGITSVVVNGVQVPVSSAEVDALSIALPVFPGKYTVSLGNTSRWVSAPAKSVVIGAAEGSSNGSVSLKVAPTSALEAAVTKQVQALLSSCVAEKVLAPTGCPFEEDNYGDSSAVVWKIVTMPTFTLTQATDGSWNLSPNQPGRATVKYNTDYGFEFTQTPQVDNDVDVEISGPVTFVAGQPVFTYAASSF